MTKRTIIEIDQGLCDGCGACETGCPEGALKVMNGKARLVGESLCDGLGACVGRCPVDAIRIVEREADEYDEVAVLREMLPQGIGVVKEHFAHLDRHGQDLYLERAVSYLVSHKEAIPEGFERFGQKKPAPAAPAPKHPVGSSGRKAEAFPAKPSGVSALRNWPIQLHLANPKAPHFADADIVIAADCTAFALGSFHADIIADKSLVIACPKLDSGKDVYLSKLASILRQAGSASVVIMEVPCCSGLVRLAQEARAMAGASQPIQVLVVGIDGGFVAQKTV
ncbi:MAG TPA: 4Fe-4S binding protein [Rectinemataceae bacterium]|nr:4Fe-4S binding protein [Rectinemataceae bacterium]